MSSSLPARPTPLRRSQAPLWYRDGAERLCWSYRVTEDAGTRGAFEELEAEITRRGWRSTWDEGVYAQVRRLLLDSDEAVAERAALLLRGCNQGALLPELEAAHRRWPRNRQIEWVFARTAANCWPDVKLRTHFWNLPPGAHEAGELRATLRREMAKCGTEVDARRLEALLPEGADWRHDPDIARIRLHRSPDPGELAFEILRFIDRHPPTGLGDWPAHLYRCELLRYLTFGHDPRYRGYIEGFLSRRPRLFVSDQETYPHGLDALLKAWLIDHPE